MSLFSPKTKSNISKIVPLALIWVLFSLTYSIVERGIMGDLKYYPATGNTYNFSSTIFITAVFALIMGLLIGAIEILYLNTLFLRVSLLKKIIFKTLIYLFFIVFFLFVNTLIYTSIVFHTSILERKVWQSTWNFFTNLSFWTVEVYISAAIWVSLFYVEVSDNLGQRVLNNFITGKYHRPTEEERIFMFLDMKSSTTHAEQMGHVRYFEMLREYYADMTDSIILHSGEIYQYVGDEVVVSWKLHKGLMNNNCIRCYFSIRKTIHDLSAKYQSKFGVLPEFKAGLHVGKVIAGEIGVIKKEIIFTGDVLNTTSRIQGLCNKYLVDLLISEFLFCQLIPDSIFLFKSFGANELKGRGEKMELFSVQMESI